MTQQVYVGDEITAHTGRKKLTQIIAEYEAKRAEIPAVLASFAAAQASLKSALCVSGVWFQATLDAGSVSQTQADRLLLKSAWRHAYEEYNLEYLASAKDKSRIDRMLESPPPFDMDNLFEWFGDLASDPRAAILRGLAEVFADLDPAFKSHEKMKIGVKGLPKRVIISNATGFGAYGRDKILSIINALASLQNKPLAGLKEVNALVDDGDCLRGDGEIPDPWQNRYGRENDPKTISVIGRGIWLKTFSNGNGHLFFAPDTLRDINAGLAEYYGAVLPDCPEERPTTRAASTDVSKDLQYYPTPEEVVRRMIDNAYSMKGKRVLEPSCGCGRIMAEIRKVGGQPFGIEYDAGRAAECRAKGFDVMRANFLAVSPSADFDMVMMNPPFYGRHYAKHVRHALRFLKPGGTLYAILPVTARYDHGELDDLRPQWSDLPVGAFRDSGTNINTTIAKITVRNAA